MCDFKTQWKEIWGQGTDKSQQVQSVKTWFVCMDAQTGFSMYLFTVQTEF